MALTLLFADLLHLGLTRSLWLLVVFKPLSSFAYQVLIGDLPAVSVAKGYGPIKLSWRHVFNRWRSMNKSLVP